VKFGGATFTGDYASYNKSYSEVIHRIMEVSIIC